MPTTRYEFTDKQEKAIGEIVADALGANLQTGLNGEGIPYIAIQRTPNGKISFYTVHPDGTVIIDQ